MATAFDIITSAYRLVGTLADGEQPPFDVANIGLGVFNDMIDSWNADRLAIYTTRSDDFPFVISQQSYTLGAGGNFNIARPARIDGMSSILLYNPTNPVEVPITMVSVEDWQNNFPVKNVSGSFPLFCYDTGDFPLRTLNFWPYPSQGPCSARIYSWQALPAQTLSANVSFPPGYAEAIRYNLAVRLCAEMNAPLRQDVAALAIKTFATIKTMNAPDLTLQSDIVAQDGQANYRQDMFGLGY